MRRLAVLLLLLCVSTSAGAAAPPAQKFVVFFQEWSAALDDSAQSAITQAAAWMKDHPSYSVKVTGFADTTGSKQANILLSELRAQMVVDQLTTDGVDAKHIDQVGRGSVQFALTSQESRRVEIAFRPH
jgi:outer membrane protein OmpA-like peptidoglycan-associated protein